MTLRKKFNRAIGKKGLCERSENVTEKRFLRSKSAIVRLRGKKICVTKKKNAFRPLNKSQPEIQSSGEYGLECRSN